MKNIFKLSVLALAAALVMAGCQKGELSTDQLDDSKLTFSAFGPNPVYRGGELTVIGSNLDQVASVVIPGVEPITTFKIEGSGRNCKLLVTVPVDGPEVGKIAIIGKNGEKLESLTELSYTQPILFSSFSPANAMPGEVITIKGDYLNLVKEVIFPEKEIVTAIESQSRYELKVKVPAHAITGRLIIGDSDELADPDVIANKVYSEGELTIGAPTVSSLSAPDARPGKSVTINGEYLQMIKDVVFAGNVVVSGEALALAEDGKTLTVELPETAQSGEVKAHSYQGSEFKAGTITMVKANVSAVAPNPVKAGAELVLTGTDLNLIKTVNLPDAAGVEFKAEATKLSLNVPAKATEGTITLIAANADEITAEYTLVHAAVSSVSPVSLKAGETISIKGTDLDLIVGAKLGGKTVEITSASETELVLTTSNTSVSGKIVFSLANGETVEPADEITLSYDSFIIVNEMPASQHIGQLVTLKGDNFMMIENIYVGDAKVTNYSMRSANEISFLMPYNKVGDYSLTFELFSGDKEICPTQIGVLLEQSFKTIWEGSVRVGNWDNSMSGLAYGAFDWSQVKAGTHLIAYLTMNSDAEWGQVRIGDGSWDSIPSGLATGYADGNIPIDASTSFIALTLTQADIDQLIAKNGMVICAANFTITKVVLVTDISQEVTLWEGELAVEDWANQPYALSDGGAEFTGAGVKAGQTINFYVQNTDPVWKIEILEGHWGPSYAAFGCIGNDEAGKFVETDLTATGGKLSFVLTQEMIDAAKTSQGWGGIFVLNGDNIKLTKITVL